MMLLRVFPFIHIELVWLSPRATPGHHSLHSGAAGTSTRPALSSASFQGLCCLSGSRAGRQWSQFSFYMERGWGTLSSTQKNTSYQVKVVVVVEGGEGLVSFSFQI